MDFIDDEVDESSDSESVLVPSSQNYETRRPAKRRRLERSSSNTDSESGADDYDLPSNDYSLDDADEDEEFVNKSRYDGLMHVPRHTEPQEETFVTQLTQPWSSPTRIRGPRWKKQASAPASASKSKSIKLMANPKSASPVVLQSKLSFATNLENRFPQEGIPGDEFDEADPELLEALVSSQIEFLGETAVTDQEKPKKPQKPTANSFRQTTLFGSSTTQQNTHATQSNRTHNWPLTNKVETPTHHKINPSEMKTWVYPTNLGRIRDYQFNIVHKGLFHNLLVALPTGLGKTFIAATIMLNWFRWTKDAQIVFVAPTKPLVAQQIDACFHIAGIPRSQTTLLTGEVSPAIRAEEWQEKRVFFMTPQTLINDLKNGMCDPKKIVLLVVDEAHKATGNYAYVEVVRFLRRFNSSFRVLALTATPGGSVEAVQKVIDGLDIAKVEIRTEESMDIRDFVHLRNTNLEIFDNSDELSMALELFSGAVKPVLTKLNSQNAYWGKDPTMLTLYGLKKARDDWSKSEAGRAANWGLKGMLNNIFNALMSLAHNLELLKFHGIGPFFHKMKIFEDENAGGNKYARQIVDDEHYKKLMNRLRSWCNDPDFVGHPKLTYLKQVVLNHFMDAGNGLGAADGRAPSDTRIMIFAHYRDSAEEVTRVLNRHGDIVRAHVFVGQSGTKGSEGMDQKTQIEIIKKFKSGVYNTLVATSIGEEGLDIGEVDLIVCYDCSKSPIRMLQRMGRTGRKRAGNIVLLLMRGKEEADYYKAKDNYLKMQEIIENGKEFTFHEDKSPRIVPKEILPVVDKCIVHIPQENTQGDLLDLRKRKPKNPKKPPKKFHMPDDVETGFTFLGNGKQKKGKPNVVLPTLDIEIAELPVLERVLLTSEEEIQLEQRYAQVSGTEPQFIRPIRLETFPEELHRTSKTARVKHSCTTTSLIRAVKQTHKPGKDWTRPSEKDIVRRFDVNRTLATEAKGSKPRPTDRRNKNVESSRTSENLDSSETFVSPEEYNAKDSFIDDEPVLVNGEDVDSDLDHSQLPDLFVNPSKKQAPEIEKPFYESQQTVDNGLSEDELPELDELVSGQKKTVPLTRVGNASMSRKRSARRRVIDSDEDDDDQ